MSTQQLRTRKYQCLKVIKKDRTLHKSLLLFFFTGELRNQVLLGAQGLECVTVLHKLFIRKLLK